MRTSHKVKDAAAEKQSYICDTFTGHGKAHQPPLPGSPVCVFPVMLLGKAGEGAAVDLVRGGGDDAVGDRAQGGGPAILQQGTSPTTSPGEQHPPGNPQPGECNTRAGASSWPKIITISLPLA